MIVKEILAEQVLRIIYGGDVPSGASVDTRDIYLIADQVYSEVIDKYITINGEDLTGEFVSVYPKIGGTGVLLKEDAVRGIMYAELPAQLVNISKGRGVRQVSAIQGETAAFIPTQSGHQAVYEGLESERMEGQIGWWLEGSSVAEFGTIIVFNRYMVPSNWRTKRIMVKMISAISSLEEDDVIPMPALLENDFRKLIVEAAREQRLFPEDNSNDNQDDQ